MFDEFDSSAYIFVHLIGSKPDANKNSNKIDGYYQITNGILINYFATKFLHINSSNVKIFAYGHKTNYDKFIYTNNKSYFQFGIDDFFKIGIKSSEIEFDYFTNFETVFSNIEQIFKNNPFKTIVIFLDDHGSKGFFAKIGYFHLYKMFMRYPDNPILVFNDSCYSGSMINIIKGYDQIYKLKIKNKIEEKIDSQLLFSFLNLIKYALKLTDVENLFEKLEELIEFYHNIFFSDDSLFEKLINLEISTGIKRDLPVAEICNFANEIDKIGFSIVQNIIDFQNIFQSMERNKKEDEKNDDNKKDDKKNDNKKDDKSKEIEKLSRYAQSKKIFTKSNLDFIKELSKDNIPLFIKSLEGLYFSNEYVEFELPPHPDIEIITSTNESLKCPSFTTIRVNNVTKVYPGSPAMSSFIKEIFMNSDKEAFNFDNVRKDFSEFEGKYIIFSVNLEQTERKIRKKRRWVHLFPKHYKQTKNNYFFHLTSDVKLKIAALRAISSLIVNNLQETIKSQNNECNLCELNSFNDNIADIIAISAILRMSKLKEADSLIKNCIFENNTFDLQDQSGIQMLRYIINFSFYLSDLPIKMTAVILNIFQFAIKYEIFQNILQKNYFKNIFLDNEISALFDEQSKLYANNDTIECDDFFNNDKLVFISDVINAVFSLLDPNVVFFGSIVALSFSTKIDTEKIIKSAYFIPLFTKNKLHQQFIENLNDEQLNDKTIIENAECYILSYVKSSLIYFDSICSLYIKNDIMRYVSHQLQYFSTISVFKLLLETIGDEKNQFLILNFLGPIEKAASDSNIPSFFIPCILASIPYNMIIYAVYIEKKSTEETINILKNIYNGNIDKNACDSFITFAEFMLMNKNNDDIDEMKKQISHKIDESIKKIIKLVNISKIRARENISRRITNNQLFSQINEYHEFLTHINDNQHTNKFHKYLYDSITSLSNDKQTISDLKSFEIKQKGFNTNKSLENVDSLLKRAVNELYTVSHIFNISDKSNNQIVSDLTKKIDSKKAVRFTIMAMTSRYLDMVEMVPISDILDQFMEIFTEEEGENPNIKELMGLRSANIHILSEKDKKHNKYKIVEADEFELKYRNSTTENHEEEEDDMYYSENYFEDKNDLPYRKINLESMEDKTYLEQYPNFPLLPKIKYHKDQIFYGKIDMIRDELDLGWSSFAHEIWKAFVYCFNDRIKANNIQFDPTNGYNDATCPIRIDHAISIVRRFFPIHEITELWDNKEKIERFIGKNLQFKDLILKCFVIAFDDADRIVSPIHLQTETYEERTSELLKLIFES